MMQRQKTSEKVGRGKAAAIVALILTTVLIVAGVAVYCLFPRKSEPVDGFGEFSGEFSEQYLQGEVVSAYGVTGIGTIQAEFPITNLENSLEIEEVYVSSGEEIKENMPVLKLTEESIETVKAELEEELRAADLAYRAGKIEYEQSKITAYYDKETTILEGEQADAVYAESISGLSANVDKAKKELEEANTQIAEYEAAIANNSYYEDYQVEYYKNLYDENLELLKEKMDEWQVSWSEVTTGNSGGFGSSTGAIPAEQSASVSGGDVSPDLHSQYVLVLSSLYNVLEQNLKDYDQAYADYEAAAQDTNFNLQTLKLQVSSLKQTYAQALESYETNISQAELTKQTAKSNAEKAENNYQANIEKAEADYEKLKSAKEEAEENMALFEQLIKDGCLYATENGTILRMNLRTGGRISSEGQLYTLRDASEMTITVSVDQSDIASLNVGDAAVVQSESNGNYNGTIYAINPISSSESKINITYSVTVKMTGNFESLSANETVLVYFGMGGLEG